MEAALSTDLAAVAADLSEGATVEEFIILWLNYLQQVNYVDYDTPNPDLGCSRTIKQSFGNPARFTEEELHDAVAELHGRRKLVMHRYPVPNTEVQGAHGKSYPQKYRVVVSQR